MPTLATVPTYPVPGRQMRVTFTLTGPSANYYRAWVTDAPAGSELRKRLNDTGVTRTQVAEGDAATVWEFEPDRGGCYRVLVQEYTLGASDHGGGYEGDPDAAPSETKVGSETTLALYVGQKMVSQCGAGQDTADLVLYVWDATIRSTTLDAHGEVSPRIENASSPRASMAAVSPNTVTALAALSDVAVTTAIGTIATIVNDLISNFNSHLSQGSVHQANDTDNDINVGFRDAQTPNTLARTVSECLTRWRQHMTNDNGLGIGLAGTDPSTDPPDVTPAPYHDVGGAKIDWTNLPVMTSVGDLSSAYRAIGDLWRCHEAHRVNTGVHDTSDTTNDLAALPALLTVHRRFFEAIAAISPTVPDSQSSGAVLLMSQTGAREV
jgi:hypothetical protein